MKGLGWSFLDIGQSYKKFSVACRVSSFSAGVLRSLRGGTLVYETFDLVVSKAKKKLRKAKKQDRQKRIIKKRKSNFRSAKKARSEFEAECFQAISDLGVKPIPSPTATPDNGGDDVVIETTNPTPTPTPGETPTPSPDPTASPTPTPVQFAGASFDPIRINSGGPSDSLVGQFVDANGNAWQNDMLFYGVESYFHKNETIPGVADQEIWQTERYGPAFSYRIPLDPARYLVVIHLAEIFWDSAEERIFEVYIEDVLAINAVDLIAEYGKFTPNVRIFEVVVTDGQLDVDFRALLQYAKVSAVEVLGDPGQYQALQ